MRTFDISRVVLGAAALGTARAAFEYARDYAKERTQFGKTIIDHQAVAFRLADMASRIDAAWLQVLNAARMIDAGEAVSRQEVTSAAAMGEAERLGDRDVLHLGRACRPWADGAIRARHPLEQWMRDAKLEGDRGRAPRDIMRLLISRNLG
jgi:alkylation response protein AidB-like acyl-CoA dehydrogenase